MAENDVSSVRVVMFTRSGPAWQQGIDAMRQIGMVDHAEYLAQLKKEGKIEYSGPFLSPGEGGMVLASSGITLEDAHNIVNADPAVVSGILDIEIRQWLVTKN